MATNTTKKMWPNNSAIVISDEANLSLIMKTLIQPLNWRIDIPPCNAASALEYFQNSIGCAFIVIDSATMPAHETLRTLFKDPRGRLIPTLVLASEQSGPELLIYEKVFKTHVIKRPLSSSNFIPTFRNLLKEWESPVYQALRTISYSPIQDNLELKINVLERLIVDVNSVGIALPALIQIFISQNNYKEAEKKLLEHFKLHPKNPLILAHCGWFYLATKMPNQALLFLNRLKNMAPDSVSLNFDITAAHLACGQLTEAIASLSEWYRRFPNNDQVGSYLARILLADGQHDKAEQYGINRQVMNKASEVWDAIEMDANTYKSTPHIGQTAS